MITPIKNISFKRTYLNTLKKTIDEPKDLKNTYTSADFKSIYNNSINFTGYYIPHYEKPQDFAQTVYENWFHYQKLN